MEKISSILTKTKPHFHSISLLSTADNALSQMCCENTEYLVVIDESGRFMGLITEHDITSGVIAPNKQLGKIFVKEIMNRRLPSATTDDTVEKCMQTMRQHHIRFLPVFENFVFKGIVSTEDIIEEAVTHRMEIFDNERPVHSVLG